MKIIDLPADQEKLSCQCLEDWSEQMQEAGPLGEQYPDCAYRLARQHSALQCRQHARFALRTLKPALRLWPSDDLVPRDQCLPRRPHAEQRAGKALGRLQNRFTSWGNTYIERETKGSATASLP